VGPLHSGKTTITDLILGFYKPDSGQVLIDDRPLQSFSLSAWRSTIGYVPQEPILFRDTIFTNVTLGDKSIGEDTVKRALELAGALDFVENMPKGIYSEVGEKGGKMSGGQRQRIAIARALVRNPRLLILDEVTSALDPDSEQEIVRNISALKAEITVVAITHRPAFLEIADHVYHLDGGNIAWQTDSAYKIEATRSSRV
jgi:ATP-binding cassette subfamily C protein